MIGRLDTVCSRCHPEPEKNADTVTHSPVAKGMCNSCHTGHGSEQPKLLKVPAGTLCSGCHSTLVKNTGPGGSRHAPFAEGACTGCHSPHWSASQKLLRSAGPDLCLGCHRKLREILAKEKVHSPASGDCRSCHASHVSKEAYLLLRPILDTCNQCHEVSSDSFKKAHGGVRAEVMKCPSCHSPHSSKRAGFFKEYLHPPFEAGSCEDCHVTEKK
jgi:predicted CXXCH cytochrome family protein